MSEQTNLTPTDSTWTFSPREVALRSIIEDPTADHDSQIGKIVDRQKTTVNVVIAANVAAKVLHDGANPLAATAVVRRSAVDAIAPPDEARLLAAFADREGNDR